MRTDDLIHELSRQAGTKKKPAVTFNQTLALGISLSAAAAMLVVLGLSRVRPDLYAMLTTWAFQFKVLTMALLTCGGVFLVRAAGIPGASVRPALALFPGIALLLVGVIFDNTDFPLLGEKRAAVPLCVGVIVAASLPGLIAIMAALRKGIPTKPAAAGAIAGLLSGAIASLVYTIACINDGPSFVALWYLVAIFTMTVIGAVVGRYVLAW